MSKVLQILILSNTPQMNYKRQQDVLILVLVCLGWCLQHLQGCLTNPLLSPTNFPFGAVYPIGDKLVFAGDAGPTQLDFYVYDPATGDWATRYFPDLHDGLSFRSWAVIGQQLIYPAIVRDNTAVDIVDFSADILQRRTINHTSNIEAGVALALANTVIFGQPERLHLVFIDIAANTSRDVQLNYPWSAATTHEDTAYFFYHARTQVYSLHNDSWTVIPLDSEIRDAYFQHGFIFNGYAIIVTNKNILKLDVLTGHWETLIQLNFPAMRNAFLHDGMLFLIVCPSMSICNTIFTYNLNTGHRFSWPYNQYNFALSSVAVFDDKLYFVNWHSNLASSTAVLVYDINDTHYSLVPAFDTSESHLIQSFYLYSALHGEYIVMPTFAEANSQVLMYDLNEGTWRSWPWPTARLRVDVVSSERFLAISGGVDPDTRIELSTVDIYNVETNSWSETTVPRDGEHNVILIDDTLFFWDERRLVGMHFVDIYNISRDQWTTHELTDHEGTHTVFNTHEHLLFISAYSSVIDIYDIINQSWKTVPLAHKRIRYGIIKAYPYLFIAGGTINETFTESIEVFNVQMLEFGSSLNLSEPRADIVPAFANPYVAFIGGMRPNGAFSSTIDIYNIQTGYWSRVILSQPELLGSNFGVAVIGQTMYLRTNNYLYILYPNLERVEQLLTPFMEGNKIVSLDKHLIGYGESASEGVFYFLDTTTRASWQMIAPDFDTQDNPLIVRNNNVIIYTNGLAFIELPVLVNNLEDQQLFLNQEITLEIDALGHRLSYMWLLNQQAIEGEYNPSLALHGNASASGTYTAIVQDHCRRTTSQAARVTFQDKPVFYSPLEDQMVLCSNESIPVSVHPAGAQVTLQWTLDGNPLQSGGHDDDSERITIPVKSLTCNSIHRLCAHATNPSGQTDSCSAIHVVHISSVFGGPVETVPNAFISEGSTVTLKVDILDSRCTGHTWYEDSTPLKNSTESYSTINVEVTDDIEKSRYYVVATCVQGSTLTSNAHQIKLSPLPLWAVVVIIIVGLALVVGAIVIIVKFRLRLNKSRQHEIELKSLLNEAKQETMAQNSTEIIHTTKWEWSSDESYSFIPLEKFPLNFDTSHLGFSKKNDPVDINYWTQGTIVVSAKEKRRSVSSFLQQSLIQGHRVEIYPPKSPKFEVKVDPTSLEVEEDGTVATLTVSVLTKMTTKTKIRMIVVLEKQKIYSSIDFTLVSKPSPWIDVDDIEMSNQILGRGGFGTVTRGTYKGQDVAVKMLIDQDLPDYAKIEFEREITIMKSLHHPNIIQFVGASNVVKRLGLVTEFAPLGSLASALEHHIVPYNLKLVIFLEIARAIQFLHSNNIIHRDIKPANVLVFSLEQKSSVHVKLTDFGTSKFVAESTMTMTRDRGTTQFMAPETLGKKPRFDTSADLFSFAVLMWEVITNESPFSTGEFERPTQIESFVLAGNRLPLPKELDSRLSKLISECWAQNPTERPPIASVVQQLSTLVYEHN